MAKKVLLGEAHLLNDAHLETAFINPAHVISVRVTAMRFAATVRYTAHLYDVAGKVTEVKLGEDLSPSELLQAAEELIA